MINIENLSKYYGSNKVLTNIDLNFSEGQVYGIVGENGAGKTTLFRCLAGMENYEGRIIYKSDNLKNVMGFLPDSLFFFSKITGREYLQLICNARKIRPENIDGKNIFDLPLTKYADSYSTGMKKKLAITGILLQNNKVFVLDEPFNGVDIQSNLLIQEIILKLKGLNKTVILSSHIFSTLKDTCDTIHLLKAGTITKSVTADRFTEIEDELKDVSFLNKIEALELK